MKVSLIVKQINKAKVEKKIYTVEHTMNTFIDIDY